MTAAAADTTAVVSCLGQLDLLHAAADAAAQHLFDAEHALHDARQSGNDAWISAAYDRLHTAITEHTTATTLAASGPPLRVVEIPACDEHAGIHRAKVTLRWICPRCGGPRGDVHKSISFDGSRRLHVDAWTNPCGHIDYYCNVRHEAGIGAKS